MSVCSSVSRISGVIRTIAGPIVNRTLLRQFGRLIVKTLLPKIPMEFLTPAARGWTMIIGYARVSTTEQNLDLQRDALKRSGCEKIIEDTVGGGKVQRTGLGVCTMRCDLVMCLRSGDSTGSGGRSST